MRFKGHQSFYIRQGWLTKGLRKIKENDKFFSSKEIDTTMELGIGSNMVSALRYWLCTVGLTEEKRENKAQIQKITNFGKLVFENDIHQQKIGTKIWFHYQIVKNQENATSWNIFFNSHLFEFDKERFLEEVKEFIQEKEPSVSEKSILDDFDCISHTYCKKEYEDEIDFEDIACPLSELGLLKRTKKGVRKCSFDIEKLPDYLALAIILDSNKENVSEIKISEIENGENSLGSILNLSISEIGNLLERLKINGFIEVVKTAGIDSIHFTKKFIESNEELSAEKCLEKYYGND